ncbi:hypothetical protein BV20DRAFT_917832, partial [Pilatotrama ljubarskyi]
RRPIIFLLIEDAECLTDSNASEIRDLRSSKNGEGECEWSSWTARVFGAYKPVAQRVKPVPGVFPEDARVIRQFPENPLNTLTPLTCHPPEFVPTMKLTKERMEGMKINTDGFLWPEEEKLFQHIFRLNEKVLAYEDYDQ